jgi:hypothetical protein
MIGRFVCVAAGLALVSCSPEISDLSADAAKSGKGLAKPAEIEADQVRLSGENISVTGPAGTTLAFGSPREAVDAELTRVLGPAEGRDRNEEGGAGPMEFSNFPGGLSVNFQDGKLVGWFVDAADGMIETDKGLAVNAAKGAVEGNYNLTMVTDSTLGDEFYTEDGVGGFFEGEANAARVSSLHAGTNCFFR